MRILAAVLLVLLAAVPLAAQRVDTANSHYRIWAIDRVITDEHGRRMPAHASGKLGFNAIYNGSDTMCVVEYVALTRAGLDDVRRAGEEDKGKGEHDKTKVRVFEKAKTKKADLAAAARAAGFLNINLDRVAVRLP